MKMQQYDTVKLKDGRKGVIVEIFGDGKELLVDIGSSPADWKTISISPEQVDFVISYQTKTDQNEKAKYYYRGVEYLPGKNGLADFVMCPLIDDWIEDIDCIENQYLIESSIPDKYKQKENWKILCEECPFRDY